MNITTNTSISKFKLICSLLSILATIGWIIGFNLGHIKFFEIAGLALITIGFSSALLVCPIKLLLFPFKCFFRGFQLFRMFIPFYGIADLCAGIMGIVCGLTFGICVVLGCPAIFTIKKLFDEKKAASAIDY